MHSKVRSQVIRYFFVIIIMVSFLYPMFNVINISLKPNSEFLKDPIGIVKHVHLKNYLDAWDKASLGTYSVNSAIYAFVVVAVSILMAIFLAFPIARNYVRFGAFIYNAFMIGMFLPDGTIPRWQMILKAGLYNTRLGYIITMVGGGGVTLLMFVSYIKSIPREFDEASTIDGCGYIQYIFRILIPLMKPAIASMSILACINAWNEVLGSIIYLSEDRLFPITRGLYTFKGNYSVQWPLLTAALVIVAFPMVLLYIFLQKYIIDGVIAGGVKA